MSTPVIMDGVQKRKVVVFSGGSAANSLVDVFNQVIENNNCSLTYVIPISDNGGSSSELIRVFGGPGIGDVRSMSIKIYCIKATSCFSIFLLVSHMLVILVFPTNSSIMYTNISQVTSVSTCICTSLLPFQFYSHNYPNISCFNKVASFA